jgi:5'-3' exonuclease
MTSITLIDLSSIVYPLWHTETVNPNPDAVSQGTVRRVRELAQPHTAICVDSKKSFRRDLDPTYKAQRDATDREPLYHQMALAIETLRADGFPIWQALGFEADDVIASATAHALTLPGVEVQIVSADKDLLALIGDRVTAKSLRDNAIIGPQEVLIKFGVRPDQMTDYLTLVGDASDNIKGAVGIGPKRAAELLKAHETIEGIYYALNEFPRVFTEGLAKSLRDFQSRVDDVRTLVQMRTDVPIPFEEIAAERVAQGDEPMTDAQQDLIEALTPPPTPDTFNGHAAVRDTQSVDDRIAPSSVTPADSRQAATVAEASVSLTPRHVMPAQVLAAAPLEWERQLEPRSLDEARVLAKFIFDSRLFGAYGNAQSVLMTVMAGREFGLQAMASLRAFHIVQGKPVLAADAIRALVLKSGLVKSFRCTERTPQRATFIAKRGDDPEMSLSYSIDEAQAAGLVKPGSGWAKYPADMLVARASAKLARLVAPEVTFGLYAPEEID